MRKQDFYFELPNQLIAQYPLVNRSDSRLLTYSRQTKQCEHRQFKDLIDFLNPGDLLVMNDTKVIPARLYGHKQSGGKVEVLIERILTENTFLAHIKASKAPKSGTIIQFDTHWSMEVTGRNEDLFLCHVEGKVHDLMQQMGHLPLPPYITRTPKELDVNRYQTVYAQHIGSVAAPTAGLHFDQELLAKLQNKGIQIEYLTLHVGAGTFRPVRTDSISDHKMHAEYFSIGEQLCASVNHTKAQNNRVIAVGTTSLRGLESAAIKNQLQPCSRETNIFITPGYQFKICDGLITNFHLPESTLLMLVSAFIGYEAAMQLYQIAIENKYRFFSYGDASLLL